MGQQLGEDGGEPYFQVGADFRYAQNLRVASTDSRTGSFRFFQFGDPGPTGGGSGLATFLLWWRELVQPLCKHH